MPDIILLERERDVIIDVMHEFWVNYGTILESASKLSEKRGAHYDTTPIHHRLSPEGLVHEILKKGRRLESVVRSQAWNTSEDLVKVILRETPDIVNYAAFLGAFAIQLLTDMGTSTVTIEHALDPELDDTVESMRTKWGAAE